MDPQLRRRLRRESDDRAGAGGRPGKPIHHQAIICGPGDIARAHRPGETRSIKGETFEFCHILDGVVELTEDGGETVTYRAGDSFVMKPGFTGRWRTVETVRKIYVTVS